MFDRVESADAATPRSCRSLVDAALAHDPPASAVALLVAGCSADQVEQISMELRGAPVPIVGGLFPGLIVGSEVLLSGALALAVGGKTKRVIFDDLYSQPALSASVRELFLGAPKSDGCTVFLLADGHNPRSIGRLFQALQPQFHLKTDYVGGAAGRMLGESGPNLFTERGILPQGAAMGLRIDQQTAVEVEHGLIRCEGPFLANKAHESTVIQLDWSPAFEIYKEAAGAALGQKVTPENFRDIARVAPLAIRKLRDELVIRVPWNITPERGLETFGTLPESSVLVLVRTEEDGLVEAAARAAKNAVTQRRELSKAPARSAFIASCQNRSDVLGSRFAEELGAIQDALDVPVAGALTLGEIGSRGRRFVEYYNNSVVVGLR